jgi:hypothetical protein
MASTRSEGGVNGVPVGDAPAESTKQVIRNNTERESPTMKSWCPGRPRHQQTFALINKTRPVPFGSVSPRETSPLKLKVAAAS